MGKYYGPATGPWDYMVTCIVCGCEFDRDEAIDECGFYDEICSHDCLIEALRLKLNEE